MAELAITAALQLVRGAKEVLNAVKTSNATAKSLIETWAHLELLIGTAETIPDPRLAASLSPLRELAADTRQFSEHFQARSSLERVRHAYQDREKWRELESRVATLRLHLQETLSVLIALRHLEKPPPPPPRETSPQRKKRIVLAFVNTADQAQLGTLPGVGPTVAAAILTRRNDHGNFAAVKDLSSVKGLGKKKLEKILSLNWHSNDVDADSSEFQA